MGLITILYCVYYPLISEKFGSMSMNDAAPSDILKRILLLRQSIESLESALIYPRPNQRKPTDIKRLLEEGKEELEETYDYYIAKLKQHRS
jgi:hypothetical protein